MIRNQSESKYSYCLSLLQLHCYLKNARISSNSIALYNISFYIIIVVDIYFGDMFLRQWNTTCQKQTRNRRFIYIIHRLRKSEKKKRNAVI